VCIRDRPSPWLLAFSMFIFLAIAIAKRQTELAAGEGLDGRAYRAEDGPAMAALAGGLLIQIATNLANDYYDFFKGSDTAERPGPVRVTQAGLLSPRSVWRGMALTMGAAFLIGVYLVAVGGWPVAVIGLLSLGFAVGYTGGPYPLSYHGLGDVGVFIFFGLAATAGTYYVQALAWSADAIVAGVGMGAFSTAILVVNNHRDRETDGAAGKRTLAVRFGDRFSVAQYFACLAVAAAVPIAGIAAMGWSPWTLLSLAGWLPCIPAGSRVVAVIREQGGVDRRTLNPALGQTARGVAFYGAGLAVGILLGTP